MGGSKLFGALQAVIQQVYRDHLPLMERIGTASHDHTSTLMAGSADRQRVMLLGVQRPIAMPDVAAADRHPLQLDEALAIRDGRPLHIDELEELGTYQLCRFHTLYPSHTHAEQAQSKTICARN